MSSGDVPFIRTSERRKFKRCPQAWWWGWREGLVRKSGAQATPLWFGTGIHEALAQWYQPGTARGVHPADYWLDWVGEEERDVRTALSDDFQEDEWVDAKDLGEAMLVGYVDKYGADDNWDVLYIETPFQIGIPNPIPDLATALSDKRDILAIFAGTFDGVYRDLSDDTIWLMEHKTAKIISTAHLPIDDQAGGYWAIASKILQDRGVLQKGDKIQGIMYNFLRKGTPDDRPVNEGGQHLNKDGSVSKNQPAPLFLREPVFRDRRERATQLRRIQKETYWMDRMRGEPDNLFKNSTNTCFWECEFYEMCLLHEKGTEDWKEYRDAMYKRRDPYADHRKSAAE